ncbi:hypothetical protein SmJEL517_g00270 [Synchytrium microbalum]|uniref:Calcineurin-like phosphoesterase domain-containing protein n=1 Tax=Synchytrium microbalum TaxID=1806994 RepID=A0A507CEB0_9FUNG|nr:uncharacterized protein SmJEL517_g00270 [Synchytrium microbalum]TPX37962.1 hypothetical protein SmJEL517_g00270 [Synchytrium microbalum]
MVRPEELDEHLITENDDLKKKKKKVKKPWNPHGTARKFGSPMSGCDSPMILVNETFNFLSQYHAESGVDFVIWTGDNARHDLDPAVPRTEAEVYSLNELVAKLVSNTFPGIPLIPSLGNNDLPFHNSLPYQPDGSSPTLNFYVKLWSKFIPEDQHDTFRKGGYYVSSVAPGLSVVALNTLYLWSSNDVVPDCTSSKTAGGVHLKWLENVLKDARESGMTVYLSGHVPPNELQYYPTCYKWFSSIATEYSDVIAGQFYGHVNLDHFFFPLELEDSDDQRLAISLIKSDTPVSDYFDMMQGRHIRKNAVHDELLTSLLQVPAWDVSITGRNSPSWLRLYATYLLHQYDRVCNIKEPAGHPAVVLVSPSVTPAYNPSLRIYFYEPQSTSTSSQQHVMKTSKPSYTLINFTQYFVNLTRGFIDDGDEGGDDIRIKPLFEEEYSSHVYGIVGADNRDWIELSGRLTGNNKKHDADGVSFAETKSEAKKLQDLYFGFFTVSSGVNMDSGGS